MNDRTVTLREYESRDVELTRDDAVALMTAAKNRLSVGVSDDAGHWIITAGGYVGTVSAGPIKVLIRPKVPLHNLLLLLDVGLPNDSWSSGEVGLATDPDLLVVMAAFFARSALTVLRRGPHRDYRTESDRLVTLRGRIDIATQLRQPGVVSPIACRFDEFDSDIPENTALRAAARRLLRMRGVFADTRRDLERILMMLDDVPDRDIGADAIDRIPITRLNVSYRPALRLASVVLRNSTLIDLPGSVQASAFLINMPLLFQNWVTDRLRRHLANALDVVAEPPVHFDEGGRVTMNPDLVFRDVAGRNLYVGDVKYKLTDALGRSGDYYQLMAYATALELVEGVLIYCQAEGSVPDAEVVARFSGKHLWTYLLEIQGSNADLESEALKMAQWISQRVSPV